MIDHSRSPEVTCWCRRRHKMVLGGWSGDLRENGMRLARGRRSTASTVMRKERDDLERQKGKLVICVTLAFMNQGPVQTWSPGTGTSLNIAFC